MDVRQHIRGIPDFPKPGILFYDISTLLAHAEAWQATMRQLDEALRPHRPDLLAGIESRGFLVAAPLGLQPRLRLHHGAGSAASCPAPPSATPTPWNTAPTRSRSRPMR